MMETPGFLVLARNRHTMSTPGFLVLARNDTLVGEAYSWKPLNAKNIRVT